MPCARQVNGLGIGSRRRFGIFQAAIRIAIRRTAPKSRSSACGGLCKTGQAVYDPFLGSGTTVIAAETTGRACLAMELEPAFVDLAVRRWEAFTGKKATLLGNGQLFEEITAKRSIRPEPVRREPDKDSLGHRHSDDGDDSGKNTQ
jgi:hypothetical protein